jgi:hypothetical protein
VSQALRRASGGRNSESGGVTPNAHMSAAPPANLVLLFIISLIKCEWRPAHTHKDQAATRIKLGAVGKKKSERSAPSPRERPRSVLPLPSRGNGDASVATETTVAGRKI